MTPTEQCDSVNTETSRGERWKPSLFRMVIQCNDEMSVASCRLTSLQTVVISVREKCESRNQTQKTLRRLRFRSLQKRIFFLKQASMRLIVGELIRSAPGMIIIVILL